MRDNAPFQPADLEELELTLLAHAWAVVPLREIHAGNHSNAVIGLRHDIDDNGWPTALDIARWEAERGYRSSYYVLHTAPYWDDANLRPGLEQIALLGHEIGIHTNAIAEALRQRSDPHVILHDAISRLRDWGHPVRGACSHGDSICGPVGFVNYEQFTECAAADGATRELEHGAVRMRIAPMPLETFGLDYEAYHLPRTHYLSDTGGQWNHVFEVFAEGFPYENGQTHILMHPDWWPESFVSQPSEVAA